MTATEHTVEVGLRRVIVHVDDVHMAVANVVQGFLVHHHGGSRVRHCKRTAALAPAAVVGVVAFAKWKIKCKVSLSSFLFSLAPISSSSISPPVSSAGPVRLPFWLLATFVDGRLAPSASVVRCPHGSTKRFSTMPCALSAHKLSRFRNTLPRTSSLDFWTRALSMHHILAPLEPSHHSRALFSSPQFSPLSLAFLALSGHSLLSLSS